MIGAMETKIDFYMRLMFESLAEPQFVEEVSEARDSQAVKKLLVDRVTHVHEETESRSADSFLRVMGRSPS